MCLTEGELTPIEKRRLFISENSLTENSLALHNGKM